MKKYDLRFFSIVVSLLFVLYLAIIFKVKLDTFNQKYFHLTQQLNQLQTNWDQHLLLIKDSIITLQSNDAISNHLKNTTLFTQKLLKNKNMIYQYPLLYKSLKKYKKEQQKIINKTFDFIQINNKVKNSLLILNNRLHTLETNDDIYYRKLSQNIIYFMNKKVNMSQQKISPIEYNYFKDNKLDFIHLKVLDTYIPKLHDIYLEIKDSPLDSLLENHFTLLEKESSLQKEKMKLLFYIIILTTIAFFLIIVFLVQDVKRQANQLLQKDKLLFNQAKHAAMGEMIDAIAHQWKQPLTIIHINTDYLYYDLKNDMLTKQQVIEFQEKIFKQIDHMYETLDQFRNFLRPNKETQEFIVEKTIQEVLTLMKDTLIDNLITVDIIVHSELKINGIPNEFKHVILNIINNSKDAFIENHIENKKITIALDQDKTKKYIYIQDNAGGIPLHIIDHIFEPNITSKEEGKGTGIGLYMTKQILDKLDATIQVENKDNGCCFTIRI